MAQSVQVRNTHIADALRIMGLIPKDADFDMTGNQHTEFKQRLFATYNISDEDFARAENFAKTIISPSKVMQNLVGTWKSTLRTDVSPMDLFKQLGEDKLSRAQLSGFRGSIGDWEKANIKPSPPAGLDVGPRAIQTPQQLTPRGAPAVTAPTPAVTAPTSRESIMQTQRDLNAKGANLTVDGIMGPKTQAAMARFGGEPGKTTTTTGGLTPVAPLDDAAAAQKLKEQYGYTSWAWNIPELKNILLNIAKNPSGFTADAITGQLMNTDWWKQNGETVADYLKMQANNPPGFAKMIQSQKDTLGAYAQQFGITIAPDRLDQLAQDSKKFGWTDQEIHDAIANEFHYQPGGADSAFVSGLKQDAKGKWLVPMTDDAIQTWGHDIASGRKSKVDYDTYMGQMAKGMWPGLSGWIDQGGDVATFVAPYKKIIGDTLEINPDTINFTDSKYIGVLNQVDKKTGTRTAMSPAETMTWARQQPEWAKTQNAHQTVAALTQKLAETMGMA